MDKKIGISIIFLSFLVAAVGLSQQFAGTVTTGTPAIVAPVGRDQENDQNNAPATDQLKQIEQAQIESVTQELVVPEGVTPESNTPKNGVKLPLAKAVSTPEYPNKRAFTPTRLPYVRDFLLNRKNISLSLGEKDLSALLPEGGLDEVKRRIENGEGDFSGSDVDSDSIMSVPGRINTVSGRPFPQHCLDERSLIARVEGSEDQYYAKVNNLGDFRFELPKNTIVELSLSFPSGEYCHGGLLGENRFEVGGAESIWEIMLYDDSGLNGISSFSEKRHFDLESQHSLQLSGMAPGNVARLELMWWTHEQLQEVDYTFIENRWSIRLSSEDKNLDFGKHDYEMRAYGFFDELVDKESFSVSYTKPATMTADWLPSLGAYDLTKVIPRSSVDKTFWSKKFGKITSGEYSGWDIITAAFLPVVNGDYYIYQPKLHRFLISPDKTQVVNVAKQSDVQWSDAPFATSTTNVIVDGLSQPDFLQIQDHPVVLKQAPYYTIEHFYDDEFLGETIPRAVLENGKTLYQHKESNCFFVAAPDGTLRQYEYDFAQMASTVSTIPLDIFQADGTHNSGAQQLNFKNSLGTTNQEYYRSDSGRDYGYANDKCMIVDDLSDDELTPLVKSDEIAQVYVLKNPDHAVLKKAYELRYDNSDTGSVRNDEDRNMGYRDFVEKNSVIYWKDPFGQWIRFIQARYVSDGNCCHGIGGYFDRKWD